MLEYFRVEHVEHRDAFVDGGVSDNIGLRGIIYSLMYPDVLISGDQMNVTDSREFNLQRMIADPVVRQKIKNPGTNFHLSDETVDLLIDQGRQLLLDSDIFQNRFLKDLKAQQ